MTVPLAADRPKALPDEIGYITDDSAVRAAVGAAVKSLHGLDILVNNAGIDAQGTVEDASDEDWRRVLDVNVVGTARVSRAAWPALRASDHAAVVNTCSIAATAGLEARQPHGRLVSADEIAQAAPYLASPRAGSTTGAEIAVDGGMAGLRLRPRT